MLMIRCILVEDEKLAQEVILSHLKQIKEVQVLAICNNAAEAKTALTNLEVDLIFLDIQLPGKTGLNFLKSLSEPPLVILTTAYADYALESYEFNVIDYLLKPISFERFSRAIGKITEGRLYPPAATEKNTGPADHIFVKSGHKFFRVNFNEIIFIEAMKDYLKIHAREFKLVTLQTMAEMEKSLPKDRFLRVHKSYIVSTAHIKTIYGSSIELEKAVIPIGFSYKNTVMGYVSRK
jgi:DNA-binding LytR/AlgR family response regulator